MYTYTRRCGGFLRLFIILIHYILFFFFCSPVQPASTAILLYTVAAVMPSSPAHRTIADRHRSVTKMIHSRRNRCSYFYNIMSDNNIIIDYM